jgi:flagellar hook-basal body complex protein FliE
MGPGATGPAAPTAPLAPTSDSKLVGGTPSPASTDFPNMLKNMLGQLNDLAQQADGLAAKAAGGEDVDLHQLMVSMDTASLGFDLGVQVRNRLLEAYQEITKMSV